MKNKKILIGSLVALGLIGAGFYFVNKKQEKVFDEEPEADFDFNNASGNQLQNILNKPKKVIKVKDYQALMKNGNLTELKKYLVGKNIYTLQNGVNIREMGPYVDNGIFDNIFLTIKNKGVFIGKVEDVVRGKDGKGIWFLISNKQYNTALFSRIKWDWSNYFYVRQDVVVVDLY
jgi:hypothetical protein